MVDFDPTTGRVHHVGLRGTARLEPYDQSRADRLFGKYLGEHRTEWPARFREVDSDGYRLVKLWPETVVARDQSYPAPDSSRESGANC